MLTIQALNLSVLTQLVYDRTPAAVLAPRRLSEMDDKTA
jgi:hypothetical protein